MREERSYEFTGHSNSKLHVKEVFVLGPDEKRVEMTTPDGFFWCFHEDIPAIVKSLMDIYCASVCCRE